MLSPLWHYAARRPPMALSILIPGFRTSQPHPNSHQNANPQVSEPHYTPLANLLTYQLAIPTGRNDAALHHPINELTN